MIQLIDRVPGWNMQTISLAIPGISLFVQTRQTLEVLRELRFIRSHLQTNMYDSKRDDISLSPESLNNESRKFCRIPNYHLAGALFQLFLGGATLAIFGRTPAVIMSLASGTLGGGLALCIKSTFVDIDY